MKQFKILSLLITATLFNTTMFSTSAQARANFYPASIDPLAPGEPRFCGSARFTGNNGGVFVCEGSLSQCQSELNYAISSRVGVGSHPFTVASRVDCRPAPRYAP